MPSLVPTPSSIVHILSGKNYREVMMDPTKNLLSAMKSNSFSRIKSALTVPGIHFDVRDPESEFYSLLMRVCLLDMAPRNRRDLAKVLLEKKDMNVNAKDREGRTALAHACLLGDAGMVKALAEDADIDPNLGDREGDSPLMHACRGGQLDVVTALLSNFRRAGLLVDEPNNQGVTPLIEAARGGHADICRSLVTIGNADVNARDSKSFNTAQDYAIASRRLSTPDILLLSPIAQKKLQARKKREAMGRSSLSELMKRAAFYPTSTWQQQESGSTIFLEHCDGKVKQQNTHKHNPLQREHLQQLNSAVFQVAKYGLIRVAEQSVEEDIEDIELPKRVRERRLSLSLPDLRDDDSEGDAKSSSSRSSSPYKPTNPSDNLLSVSRRPSPCTSPQPRRKSLSISPCTSPQPRRKSLTVSDNHPKTVPKPQQKPHPPRLKLPPVADSLNLSPASARRRGSFPNKAFSGVRPIPIIKTTRPGMKLSGSPPNNWAPSVPSTKPGIKGHGTTPVVHVITANKNVDTKARVSWEGKPSSSVPSYLFR